MQLHRRVVLIASFIFSNVALVGKNVNSRNATYVRVIRVLQCSQSNECTSLSVLEVQHFLKEKEQLKFLKSKLLKKTWKFRKKNRLKSKTNDLQNDPLSNKTKTIHHLTFFS